MLFMRFNFQESWHLTKCLSVGIIFIKTIKTLIEKLGKNLFDLTLTLMVIF